MTDELVKDTTPVDGVRVLQFNRPSKRNALSGEMISVFLDKLSVAAADKAIRAIIVTGGNSFFSAGADIKEIAGLDSETARQSRYLENLCDGMRSVAKPMIAAVEGMALGGGFEVALMCDIIVASSSSCFGLPEVSIGLIPGAGGTQRLTNAVGKFKAMHMILLGSPITAADAHSSGLVSELYEPGQVLEHAISTASRLASLSSTALSLAKEAVSRSDELGRDDEFERNLYYFAFGTQHKEEGVGAFLEKRAPKWNTE